MTSYATCVEGWFIPLMYRICCLDKCISLINLCVCVCVLVVEPAERKPGGGESSPVGPDPDFDAAESHPPGADHGEQGPVPRRGATVYVSKQGAVTR